MNKKILAILIAVVTIFSASTTAFAHGHKRNTVSNTKNQYALCNVESCYTTEKHKHNNVYYMGHHNNDGHDYHEYCSQSDCTVSSFHSHDGVGHFGHNNTQTNKNTHHNKNGHH